MKYLRISFILLKKKSDINPFQLKRYIYKTFCKKKSSEELIYLNTPRSQDTATTLFFNWVSLRNLFAIIKQI